MRAVLEVSSGPLVGQKVLLRRGDALRVGSGGRADLVVANDAKMASAHFALAWDGDACRLTDLSHRGTRVNGAQVTEASLGDRAWITAGETSFILRIRADERALPLTPPALLQRIPEATALLRARALAALQQETEPLFAVLDAARDARILALLHACEDERRSLYEGLEGQVLAQAAPYLVRLEPGSALLDALVREGWGESWGVYLTCQRPFREVRQQLRRSLIVNAEGSREPLYFRFYDPRVLRVFLPTCTPRQVSLLKGEIRGFFLEGESGELLRL